MTPLPNFFILIVKEQLQTPVKNAQVQHYKNTHRKVLVAKTNDVTWFFAKVCLTHSEFSMEFLILLVAANAGQINMFVPSTELFDSQLYTKSEKKLWILWGTT